MTDMPETHTARSFAWSDPRTTFVAMLTIAQGLRNAATTYVHRQKFEDPRPMAERFKLAESLREEARRKVDRLMM